MNMNRVNLRHPVTPVGFTYSPNRRIDALVQNHMMMLTLDEKFKGDVRGEAWRIVARKLPAPAFGVKTRPFREMSKYNQANTVGHR